ncbi:MAG: transposase family protein, partial [Acidobacteria bacterium]|nr:transposase family protein [Acidobacteriota bacterium]
MARNSVRKVLVEGVPEVPGVDRGSSLDPYLDAVRALHESCAGNVVRVREELLTRHRLEVGYSTLTAFCRSKGIGVAEKIPAGRYHFDPGQEMQHDTSPHTPLIQGQARKLQCASLVLCFSRRRFMKVFTRWTAFEARCFLTEAIVYFGGSSKECMIDNSSVIIARGTGSNAVPSLDMNALAQRFGFAFHAHAVGDANRSARVERPFDHVERNFYAGRDFSSIPDLNSQLRAWCDRVNSTPIRSLGGASPDQLFLLEKGSLQPLPC